MKHPVSTTLLLLFLFVAAQVIGLSLVGLSIEEVRVSEGAVELERSSTAIGERPRFQGYQSFLFLVLGVGIGTVLLLYLMRSRKVRLWQLWFFLAVFLSTAVALGVLINHVFALAIGALLAYFKVYRRNPVVHNLTEILMYGGLAVLLVPLFDILWASILLVAVSIYDAIAVWKTKHMVEMAKFQTKERLFAGLFVPRGAAQKGSGGGKAGTKRANRGRVAILGGGDIAFPLIFSGVVLEHLIMQGVEKSAALLLTLSVTATTTAALALLFYLGQKDRFYPAMPFVSLGCFAGLVVLL